jgi:hypothetical protein
MRGRLSIALMALVALALVLSLVAAMAPDASAQDATIPAGEPSKWMRYNMPAMQDSQVTPNANSLIAEPKNCCITLEGGPVETVIVIAPSGKINGFGDLMPRWFCGPNNLD